MRAASLAVFAVAASLLACTEEKAPREDMTAPETPKAEAPATSAPRQVSSVCMVYELRVSEAKDALARDPGNADMKSRLDAYQDLIDDTCN